MRRIPAGMKSCKYLGMTLDAETPMISFDLRFRKKSLSDSFCRKIPVLFSRNE
jgi:hypothetical protein